MKVTSARKGSSASEKRSRFGPGVRVGPGSLVEDDVHLGEDASGSSGSKELEIGRDAIIRAGAEVHPGVLIGDRLEVGRNVVIGEGTSIGDDCEVWNNTLIDSGCTIGNRVRIGGNCYIAQFTTIADDVGIAPGVCLANDPHPGSRTHLCMRGPTVERRAQIGMNATIFPFVTIGERSLVEAGSVVTRDVPAEHIVAGNPARIVGTVADVTCPLDLAEGRYLDAADQDRPDRGVRQPSSLGYPRPPAMGRRPSVGIAATPRASDA